MLGDTLVVTLDGSGGTAKTLVKINQDGYRSEYYLDDGASKYRATVSHSKDKVKSGANEVDRHTVYFERFQVPDGTYPLGRKHSITMTIRNDLVCTSSDVIDLSEAMSFYMVKAGGVAAKLIGWES